MVRGPGRAPCAAFSSAQRVVFASAMGMASGVQWASAGRTFAHVCTTPYNAGCTACALSFCMPLLHIMALGRLPAALTFLLLVISSSQEVSAVSCASSPTFFGLAGSSKSPAWQRPFLQQICGQRVQSHVVWLHCSCKPAGMPVSESTF
jgi:hypothetical protein